jgi:hypothetical protein
MKTHVKTSLIYFIFLWMSTFVVAQPTISGSFAFGSYQHFNTAKTQLTAMLNMNAGYMFKLKHTTIQPLTELNVLIPLENDHPFSFALRAGAFFPLSDKISFIVASGPEIHIQELYKYPLDGKDGPNYPQKKRIQLSGKLRIMKQFQDDEVTKLFTEFSYDQTMTLIKFGMFIIIKKRY